MLSQRAGGWGCDAGEKDLPAGAVHLLPVPAGAGGAIDLTVSFSVARLAGAASGFGVTVRAPAGGFPGGIALNLSVSAPDAAGSRNVAVGRGTAPGTPAASDQVLPYMNDTDLPGGDLLGKTTHLPPGTDPHACGALSVISILVSPPHSTPPPLKADAISTTARTPAARSPSSCSSLPRLSV